LPYRGRSNAARVKALWNASNQACRLYLKNI
jgi:hypothetical protein